MRKEARLLHSKALDSLVLSIECFNRPWDRGRADAVLILLDHAFEMLLKACIVHRGGKIRERRAKQTLGFDACVRRALSDARIKFLSEEQALTLQTINALRDAAQHYLLEIPEQQLYLHSQAGVTLFADLLGEVFDEQLASYLPDRVLPVSTSPPRDLATLIENEIAEISALLAPGKRRRLEARARVRTLAIVEASVQGERVQPGTGDLNRILDRISEGSEWTQIFPGVAALRLDTSGEGIAFSLRIVKNEDAIPIRAVKATDAPEAAVVAIKRVKELDYYSLGLTSLAKKIGLTAPKTLAMIQELDLQDDNEYFKVIRIGASRHKRYSEKALARLREAVPDVDIDKVWQRHRPRARRQ